MGCAEDLEKIASKENRQVKFAAKLASSAHFRKEQGLFFLEGARLCADAWASGVEIAALFVTGRGLEKYAGLIAPCIAAARLKYEISEEISMRLSDTQSPQGVFCLGKILDKPRGWNTIKDKGLYLALENVQDPANLGAVCRTGEALGISGILVSGGCDRYNPKALRASMGSLLRVELMETPDLPETLHYARRKGMQALACVPDQTATPVTQVDFSGGAVAVIGNEGNGLTDKAVAACSRRITIPMRGRAESLNASMAAGLLIWEMLRPQEG